MDAQGVRFLIVDDVEANRLAMRGLLQRDGLELIEADSGRQALEVLLACDIALAIIDVQMPEMDGFELAELMRGSERTTQVPIIFVTAGTATVQRHFRGYELGAVDFLFKPFDPHVLRSKANVFFQLACQRSKLLAAAQENARLLQERTAAEERYRIAAEASGALVYEIDATDATRWSHGIGRSLGKSPVDSQASKNFWVSRIHPDDVGRALSRLEACVADVHCDHFFDRYRVRLANGSWRHVEDFCRILRGPDGRAERLIGAAVDITEQAEAEAKLQQQYAELDAIYREAPLGLCLMDRSLRFMRVNERLAAINGVAVEDHLGKTVGEVLPSRADKTEEMLQRIVQRGEPERFELRGETPAQPGVERIWDEYWYPLRNGSGEVAAVGVIVDEVTEERRAQQALREHAEQLKEADHRKNEFLATLAHELRNPLAPIRNAVALLKKPGLSQEHFEFARDIIENQLDIMVRLIDDLLDVSRISRGKIELMKERVELKTIIDQAIETSRPHIEENGHELIVELPKENIWLDGDPVRLAQVFGNLLNNAAKYSERNGNITLTAQVGNISDGTIRMSDLSESEVQKSATEVVVSVVDSGIGIQPEHLPRLFEIFSQVESALTRSRGGLGIGLSLVKGIVERHGGAVAARSEGIGKGSEFIVRLPIANFEYRNSNVSEFSAQCTRRSFESEIPRGEAPSVIRHPPSFRHRVLVVDDNVTQARSLAMLLERLGFEARHTYSGTAALDLVEEFRPQIALVDIGLPDMTGYELAQRLRKLPDLPRVRLIAQTGWGRDEDLLRARAAGFDAHLTKPIRPDLLEQMLRDE